MINEDAFKGLKSKRSLFLGSLEPNEYIHYTSEKIEIILNLITLKET